MKPASTGASTVSTVAARAVDWRAFYRGFGSNLLGSFPSAAVFFSTYEYTKKAMMQRLPSEYHSLAFMAAGGFADGAACCVRVPFEVVKQQSTISKYLKNIVQILASAYIASDFSILS
jgi:hypothetical protein